MSLPTPHSPCPPLIPPHRCWQIRQLEGSLFPVPSAPHYSVPPDPALLSPPGIVSPTSHLPVHHPLLPLHSPLLSLRDI